MEINTIYCGDNLEVMAKFPENSIDLIYADPPFFSNATYEKIWGDAAETRSFDDRWKGDIEVYIDWMKPRLAQCRRLLKDTGSMYLHCDWHANAHLRIAMDEIFGVKNFQNEIIWWYGGGGASKMRFARKHDNIYFYSKSQNWKFNVDAVREQYSEQWRGTPRADGSLRDFDKGKIPDDVLKIHGVLPMGDEAVGYPTQKPLALLRKIIKASSDDGDLILDPFCGCGTTVNASQDLERKWIGIDVSPTACRTIAERMSKKFYGTEVKLIGMPTTIEEFKGMKPFEFQNHIVNEIHGTHSLRKSGDGGIDGFTFMNRDPIQIKQSEHVGVNVVKNFQPSIDAVNKTKGFIIAFSFAKGSYEEVARAKDKYEIKLVRVDELQEFMKQGLL